jgi:hypothetical protein
VRLEDTFEREGTAKAETHHLSSQNRSRQEGRHPKREKWELQGFTVQICGQWSLVKQRLPSAGTTYTRFIIYGEDNAVAYSHFISWCKSLRRNNYRYSLPKLLYLEKGRK